MRARSRSERWCVLGGARVHQFAQWTHEVLGYVMKQDATDVL